jgi:tRNA threonylcarbamoyladenosine biosynthesis protein TsaE
MATFISNSPAETEALGESWGRAADTGWVIGLSGELGAGKTQLVKGIARGLGITTRVHSPTFNLLNEYQGERLRLFHLDLYRLDSPQQVHGAGLDDYLWTPDGVAVIEWIERWLTSTDADRETQQLPPRFRWARIEAIGEQQRQITYEDFGG